MSVNMGWNGKGSFQLINLCLMRFPHQQLAYSFLIDALHLQRAFWVQAVHLSYVLRHLSGVCTDDDRLAQNQILGAGYASLARGGRER